MIVMLAYHSEQSKRTMLALSQGLGEDVALLVDASRAQPPTDVDVVVVWGSRLGLEVPGVPVLYLEAGYINGQGPNYIENRLRFVSAEWNGLGALGDWVGECPSDRWRKLGIYLAPWKPPGPNLLVLEQHPGDAAANPQKLQEALDVAGDRYVVRRRPHPLVANTRPLREDLDWADVALTFGSTAAVEAVLAGVPTVTLSARCVARPVTTRTLACIARPPREVWAHALAYRQWSHAELASGEAWRHLRPRARAPVLLEAGAA